MAFGAAGCTGPRNSKRLISSLEIKNFRLMLVAFDIERMSKTFGRKRTEAQIRKYA
jgi:hypothetical protein